MISVRGARRVLRALHRKYVFARTWRRIRHLSPSAVPPPALLSDLVYGWGNEGFSAESEYMLAFLDHAWRASGPILECGSGLSTLLLGLTAGRTGNTVWSLEHDPAWGQRVQGTLRAHGIRSVELCVGKLRDYGAFHWYDPPLPWMPSDFGLVVCDGPPGDTPGGRYGLASVMRARLRSRCVVLLDDLQRTAEQEILARWKGELGGTLGRGGQLKPFGILTLP